MANFVKIAVLSPVPARLAGMAADAKAVDLMLSHWEAQAAKVLCDKPDLIVTPECSDRFGDADADTNKEYYAARGDKILHFWQKTASDNQCCISYSAIRHAPGGELYNSTRIITCDGGIAGVYDKNYPTTGEVESGIKPGSRPRLIDCGFGKIACAICFDLNFDSLRLDYARQRPDLIVFSSMYHGGLMQNYWAYSCRAHFIGAIAGAGCNGSIISPVGSIIAESTNYYDFTLSRVNLDCGVFHIDFNGEKFPAIKKKYGPDVKITDPGLLGAVLISCEADGLNIDDVREEFKLERLDDYFIRAGGVAGKDSRQN